MQPTFLKLKHSIILNFNSLLHQMLVGEKTYVDQNSVACPKILHLVMEVILHVSFVM